MKKVFFGFKVSARFKERLLDLKPFFESSLEDFPVRWIDPDNFHLTFLYVGLQSDATIEHYGHALQSIKMQCLESYPIGYRFFGNSSPRALALELDPEPFVKIIDGFNAHFETLDLNINAKEFRPHLTFARHRGKVSPERLEVLENITGQFKCIDEPLSIKGLCLFESIPGLKPSLVRYPILFSTPLTP